MSLSLGETSDAIAALAEGCTLDEIAELATQCESHLANVEAIMDATENALRTSQGPTRLVVWFFIDRLAKQHSIFLDALRPRLRGLATAAAPAVGTAEWDDFKALLKSSIAVVFGAPLVSLILLEIDPDTQKETARTAATSERSQGVLALHSNALRTTGAFSTKSVKTHRPTAVKHVLQVKTIDSQMAMNMASSYAPARPQEIAVPEIHPDADAPHGYVKTLPSDYLKNYENTRRKRLREVMERNREEMDRRQEDELLQRVRGTTVQNGKIPDYSDVVMPLELPRDEHGVKRGFFPLGVRFIREAIRSCGGAVELDVLVNRLSTLASKETVAEFGDVREFLLIHRPTFRMTNEKNRWIVRLAGDETSDPTWESLQCPLCSKVMRGRNLARHLGCRQCVTTQIALGLHGEVHGPISELALVAKFIIDRANTYDDWDLEWFTDCIERAAGCRRFKLSSQSKFAPILKAMRVVRNRWLARKGVTDVADAVVDPGDAAVANLFRTIGRNVNRLPIPWLEMGDVVDMCRRFSCSVLPPFNPPPRPADPRISLHNEYPGFLLCESEVDDEDDPSDDEEAFSDDEAPTFVFAPPVELAETLFTAGFERDTKRLQHRMRIAPPLVLQRVLKGDRSQTQREMYADARNAGGLAAPS
ncbi:hypothetical protein TraAM80_05437 [Trypanosoma rangeli]|uniref:Uncharacterized protein n=1 Tax=Trypanosoma rangeli TaxID=5698 RepID=A0A422NF47_TRYRA|nr:uncharacterized protein TraAM80_05437 [Trypanosoma rangeli]RNF04085.1 hypothetical protein TraAM80_05437 [Trypanosoma rangeli]|eukprot:RNF04085.1 hypothetical protein TraAM80_05437 [Trypanosoma rangeli]